MLRIASLCLVVASLPAVGEPFRDLSFDAALEAARKEDKVVLVDFFTTWCVPCKKLDQETWPDASVRTWLAEKTVALKIDAEKERALAQRYTVEMYPTIVLIAADGKEIERILGFKDPQVFLHEARTALANRGALARMNKSLSGVREKPLERLKRARALEAQRIYAQALDEYLWCLDHGIEADRAFAEVRASSLVDDLVRLAGVHPPAREALEARRAAIETRVIEATAPRKELQLYLALNQKLGRSTRSLEVFDQLARGAFAKREYRKTALPELLELLVEHRRYADALENAGNVLLELPDKLAAHEKQLAEPAASERDEAERKLQARALVKTSLLYFEAHLGTGNTSAADRISLLLLDFEPTPALARELVEHAVRAGALGPARKVVEDALLEVEPAGHTAVRALVELIPKDG